MTHKDFTIWLKGYLDACCELNKDRTQKIKDMLEKVSEDIIYPAIPMPNIPPMYPPYPNIGDYTANACPMGGTHEYPEIWHGTIPPSCKKCGQNQQPLITYCNTPSAVVVTEVTDLRDGSRSEINYRIPVSEDGTFQFEVSQDGILKTRGFEDGVHKFNMQIPITTTEGQQSYKDMMQNKIDSAKMTAKDYSFSTNGENIQRISDLVAECWKDEPKERLYNVITVWQYEEKRSEAEPQPNPYPKPDLS